MTKADSHSHDRELMRRIASSQDREAFRQLTRIYMRLIFAIAFRMGFDKEDAEDVAQETWVRVWQKADTWREDADASVKAWIGRIAYNLCIDEKRRIKRTGGRNEGIEPDSLHGSSDSAADTHKKQVQRIVGRHLAALPENQRVSVILCHYHGYSNAEAAKTLGVSIKAVESLLIRGRRTLRKQLGHSKQELLSWI